MDGAFGVYLVKNPLPKLAILASFDNVMLSLGGNEY